jgi:uncharacterized membrane protein
MRLDYLVRGLPGHPIHPPLTDATIGAYTAAVVMGFASIIGVAESGAAHGFWLALVVGLIFTGPTALTGLIDWLSIETGTPLWRTATSHMIAMLTATAFFVVAAIVGHGKYTQSAVSTPAFVLALIGFGALTVGGWLGGAVVYVHGMRVLSLPEEPAAKAAAPYPSDEKVTAEEA